MLGDAVEAVLSLNKGETEEERQEEEGCTDELRERGVGVSGGIADGFVAVWILTIMWFVWTWYVVEWVVFL